MATGLSPAVATPSMSFAVRPASARVLRAASACRPITDTSGILPSLVVSAAPTTAMERGFIGASGSGRLEQGKSDGAEGLEGDLERHVELQRFGGLRATDDIGHHPRPLGQFHHGDGMRS